MKILYFAFVELDIPNACRTHTLGILSGFCNNGCKVDAIIPRPKKQIPHIYGLRFFYIWPWGFSNLGKRWTKFIGGLYLISLCFLKDYDAIYVREIPFNPFPRWCAKIFKIPYFIEFNGLPALIPKIKNKRQNYYLKIKRKQKKDCQHAEGLIVSSFPRSQWLVNNYDLEHSKVHTILNGAEISQKKMDSRKNSLKRLNLPDNGFYLGYLGTVWKGYDLKTIVQAMGLCKAKIPNLYLIIIGSGPELPYLNKLAYEEGISKRIVNLGFLSANKLHKIMGAIDVGLMNLTTVGLNDLGPITTRFATYATFRIPVIANTLFLNYYADDLTTGLSTVPHEDPYALAELIEYLYRQPEVRKKNASTLYEYVIKNLTWKSVAQDTMHIMQSKKAKRLRTNNSAT
jgi:glycosyltransferase involved in cell wall biosynthesis